MASLYDTRLPDGMNSFGQLWTLRISRLATEDSNGTCLHTQYVFAGIWGGVGLCIAAGLHFAVTVYAALGMLGTPSLSFEGGYIGKRF
jgi:hypothetical protein